MFVAAMGSAFCQNPNSGSAPGQKPDFKGKSLFELRCALCHGLDGLGGEHAPDVVRRPEVKALSDEGLFNVIHDGIPQQGMPGFGDMTKKDTSEIVAYLRFLQGKSATDSTAGDPARGRELFFGKPGCSTCHRVGSHGQFAAGDLAGYARDHQISEIRDAILRPPEGQRDTATAVARDGRTFSGMIRNEDNSSLQLQDEDGRFYLLMKSTLVSVQRQSGARMPADYGQRLSSTDVDDLVGYIVREVGKPDFSSAPSGKSVEPHAQD